MKKERQNIAAAKLLQNEGQLDWLPRNPRQWTQTDIDRTVKSITEDEDFLEDRPLLAVPCDGKYLVFAGNLRTEAIRRLKLKQVPVVVYVPEGDEDQYTIKRRAMKDNGSFGSWDYDTLANEWDDMPLIDYGLPSWDVEQAMRGGLSSKGREGEDGYDEFVGKFEQKLTTDDCYTPPAVYEAVREFVDKRVCPLKDLKIVRPFFPGGDYTKEDYTGGVVIDNPPFSILSQILRFYMEKGINFFLFAPALTLFSAADCDLTYLIPDAEIEYENGAKVRTGFITNLIPDLRIWLCPELREMIEAAQAGEDKTKQGFVYPDNIVTAAILGKIAKRGIELQIPKVACEYIKESDSAKEQGRALYGGGFILAERAAAERAAAERAAAERAAAERAAAERAAAERATATKLLLSERERGIIARLDEQYH